MLYPWTMDKLCPTARPAEDCGLVLQTISSADSRDPTCSGKPFRRLPRPVKTTLRGKKIGVIREDFQKYGEPEVERCYKQALEVLKGTGGKLMEVKLPDFPYDVIAETIISADAATAFEVLVQTDRTKEIIVPEGKVGLYAGRVISALTL
jgi:aspartyl-tRNA(Asn)/glutamyl-tRNA(Gln) amidotransferase subunit A